MKNMKSIAKQASAFLLLGMAVCSCTYVLQQQDHASYVSVLAGCGKKENTTTAGNEGNSQVSQTQESSSKSEEKSISQSNDQLESQISIFNGFTAQIPKGYTCTGTAYGL